MPPHLPVAVLFEDVGDAVVVADEERRIVYVNPAATTLFGYTAEELLGERTALLYADSASFVVQGKERFNAAAVSDHEVKVVRYRTRCGRELDGETRGGPLRDDEGRCVGFIGIIRDATARRSAARTMRRLHDITSDRRLDFDARLAQILALGAEHFGMPLGILSEIEGETYIVRKTTALPDELAVGTTFDMATTYCWHTLQAGEPVGFHHAGQSEIATHPCYQTFRLEAYLGAAVVVDGERYGTLNFSSPTPRAPFREDDRELVAVIAQWVGHEIARERDVAALEAAKDELQRLAATDELTGASSRRQAKTLLDHELRGLRRSGTDISVLLIDLDHFKAINDRHGHAVGDAVLKAFADTCRRHVRDEDVVARWGGEEFLVLLRDTGPDEAQGVADRLLRAVRSLRVPHREGSLRFTASFGGATSEPGDDVAALLARADTALYDAKNGGRDGICYAEACGAPWSGVVPRVTAAAG